MQKSYIKHMVCAVLAVVLLLWAVCGLEAAAAQIAEATPLASFTYTLDAENGTLTLTKYTGTDSSVVVAGSYMVEGTAYATRLEPKTVFRGNTAITSVSICKGVGLAGSTAAYLFAQCTKLTQADISGLNTTGVTSFRGLFSSCAALKKVDLTGLDTSCVVSMAGMFSNCAKLAELTGYESWNTGAMEDLYMAFDRTGALKKVDISRWDLSHITNSGWCFQACGASQILLPDNLKVISAGFLNHATNYVGTSFTIPVGVEKIGYAHTFYDFGTSNFSEFIVAEGNTSFTAIDGVLYSADGKKLLAVPRGKTFENGVFAIPEGVTFLGELSFSRNQHITELVLPDSLEIYNVGLNDENYILYQDVGNLNAGSNLSIAVYCYTGITQYAVKPTNPRYTSVDGILYSKDMKTVVAVPSRYDQSICIPEGVTSWRSEAMWAIDAAVVNGLMSKCPGVSIPSTLVDISQDQIDKLNRLNKAYDTFVITVSSDNPAYCLDEKGNLVAHSFTAKVEKPTCTEGGYTISTCDGCGYRYTHSYTDPLGHSMTSQTVAPDCTNSGYTFSTCSVCGYSSAPVVLDPLGHSMTSQIVEPDCTKGGYTQNICSVCDHSFTSDPVAPLGHSFTEYLRQENTKIAACDRGCGATDTILLSSDCNLAQLQVEGYPLTPVFQADITTYTVELPYEAERLPIVAAAQNSNAAVQVIGGEDLLAGQDNTIQVICTAEDGSEKIYTVIAKRAAAPEPTDPPATLPVQDAEPSGMPDDLIVWVVVGAVAFVVAVGVAFVICRRRKGDSK